MVITGLSGSGKSSLAFDTLYAEGQRRYVESLSAYARQFLQLMDKPDVDMIEGLSPAISIEQKATSHNPRSTVGTVTEIHDYLRLLYARAGTPYCPTHDIPLQSQTVSQMVDAVLACREETRLMILAPVARERKGEFVDLFAEMQAQGYVRFRVDGQAYEFDDLPKLKKTEKHDIDVVIDRLKVRPDVQQRLAESFEAALRLADGRAIAVEMDSGKEHWFNAKFACPICNYSISRTRAAPVLVQLAGGRLPDLRRPGPHGVLRPGAGGGLPQPVAGQRRDQGLGPAQRLLLQPARKPGAALQVRRRRAVRGTAPSPCARRCCTARARKRSASATRWSRAARPAARSPRSMPSKASSPTWSGATARPIRWRCAKSWRAIAACSPAPTATARACAAKRAT